MTKTLYAAIQDSSPQAKALIRHLGANGLNDWGDLTKVNLLDFRDYLLCSVSPGAASQYCRALSAVLNRYSDEGVLPYKDFAGILTLREDKVVKTFLTPGEIERLERVEIKNLKERYVLNEFLVGCKTGARISDIKTFTSANIVDGRLIYTSIKTGTPAIIPCAGTTSKRIEWLRNNPIDICLMTYNRIIQRLCKRALINDEVKVHKGGEDRTGPKWQFITSHSARVSLCTNLSAAGTSTENIAMLVGHSSPEMTNRYICRHDVTLNEQSKLLFA